MAKTNTPLYKEGDTVRFLGYAEAVPEQEQFLEEGQEYEVSEVVDDGSEQFVAVLIDNPEFNEEEDESETNPRLMAVEAYFDEVEPVTAKPAARARGKAEEKAAPAKKTAAKTKPQVEEADDEGEDDEAEEKPKAAAKGKTKEAAKPATKAATKAPAKAATKAPAKAAAKAKPKAEEDEEDDGPTDLMDLTEEQESASVLELVSGISDDELLELATDTVEEESAIVHRLGGILYHVRKSGAYKQLSEDYQGNRGFELYVNDVLGLQYRKAMYLIKIYYNFSKYGLNEELVDEIGWSKASKIASVMNEDNAQELVDLASKSTVSELTDHIKQGKKEVGGVKGTKVNFTTFKFRLFEDRAVTVTETLNAVASAMGYDNLNDAFEHIVMEYAVEHPTSAPEKTAAKPVAAAKAKAKATAKA